MKYAWACFVGARVNLGPAATFRIAGNIKIQGHVPKPRLQNLRKRVPLSGKDQFGIRKLLSEFSDPEKRSKRQAKRMDTHLIPSHPIGCIWFNTPYGRCKFCRFDVHWPSLGVPKVRYNISANVWLPGLHKKCCSEYLQLRYTVFWLKFRIGLSWHCNMPPPERQHCDIFLQLGSRIERYEIEPSSPNPPFLKGKRNITKKHFE